MKKAQNIISQFLYEISSRFNLGKGIVEKEWKLFMKTPSPAQNTFVNIILIDDVEDSTVKDKDPGFTCIFEYRKAPHTGRICGASVKSGNVCSKHKNAM